MNKGLEILFNAYCSNDGLISEKNLNIAKEEGFMFDYPKFKTHDQTLERLFNILNNISADDIANAFLYSLSTRELEYRSALGSYWYAKAISKHALDCGHSKGDKECYYCGWIAWNEKPNIYDITHGLNIYNFERYRHGGIRHTYLNYALFDLEQFLKLPKVTPTEDDKNILTNILNCVNMLDDDNKVGKLRNIIIKKKIFKTNKNELSVILEILGICGILYNDEFPCYCEKFADLYDRSPIEHTNDFGYPINRWRANNGINNYYLNKIFKMNLQ